MGICCSQTSKSNSELQASQGYTVRPCHKQTKTKLSQSKDIFSSCLYALEPLTVRSVARGLILPLTCLLQLSPGVILGLLWKVGASGTPTPTSWLQVNLSGKGFSSRGFSTDIRSASRLASLWLSYLDLTRVSSSAPQAQG